MRLPVRYALRSSRRQKWRLSFVWCGSQVGDGEYDAEEMDALPRLLDEGWTVHSSVGTANHAYIILTGQEAPEPGKTRKQRGGARASRA